VSFERSSIDPMAFYALRGRIVAGATVLFETRHAALVAPLSGDKVTLMLSRRTDSRLDPFRQGFNAPETMTRRGCSKGSAA
jgi:hypothetical protein